MCEHKNNTGSLENDEILSKFERARAECESLKEELELQQWANKKTNEGIKILYKELEKKNEELQKFDQLKSDFFSMVSHELRTPLASIREGVSQTLDGILGETTEQQREFLSVVLSDIDRLKRIIDSLLDVSRIEAGRIKLRRWPVDIIALIKEVNFSFYSRTKDTDIEIREELPENLIEAYIDRDKIIQVFTNLIGNSFKFTKTGYIETAVVDKGKYVECCVADTGIGIAEADLPGLFGKFYQINRVEGPGERGTGLGLSITKSIVELHGGEIRVESRLNRGTRVFLTLPKYYREDVLKGVIEVSITKAEKEGTAFSLLILRLENYSEIEGGTGKDGILNVFLKILEEFKDFVTIGDYVPGRNKSEIVLLANVEGQEAEKVFIRLRKIIEENVAEVSDGVRPQIFYGHAEFSSDVSTFTGLLEKADMSLEAERRRVLRRGIMIVDDEPVVVDTLRRILTQFGHNNLTEAYSGDEMLQKLKTGVFSLFILDINMPRMDGYELIGRLKENVNTKDVPILIVSAYDVEIEKLDGYANKGSSIPVIRKPFDAYQIEKTISHLL